MIKDVEAHREICISEAMRQDVSPHVIDQLIEEAKRQLTMAALDEASKRYPCSLSGHDVEVTATIEKAHLTRDEIVSLKATIRGASIQHNMDMKAIIDRPMIYHTPHKIDKWVMDEMVDECHGKIKLLHAMLDELLPNWRDVYDRLEREELNGFPIRPIYGHKYFTPEYFSKGKDAGEDSDSPAS